MTKVVINTCYGGFDLSNEAYEKLIEYGYDNVRTISPQESFDGMNYYFNREPDRADCTLVKVVEELGERANGPFSELKVVEVSGLYTIKEYDGKEWIDTPDTIQWSYAE